MKTPLRTVLGFDYGSEYIGVAVGQVVTHTARPLTTLRTRNNKPDWDKIEKLLAEWQPDLLVVGLPLDLDGTDQELTRAATRFGNQLNGRFHIPVEWMDERLTTVEADRILKRTRGQRYKKEDIDMLAAQLILQSWLEQQAHEGP